MLASLYAARAASSAHNQLTAHNQLAVGGLSSASNALLLNSFLADEQRRQTLLASQLPGLAGLNGCQQDMLRALIIQRNAEHQVLAGAGLLPNMASADSFGGLSLSNLGLSNPLLTQAGLAAAAQQQSALLGVPSQRAAAAPQEERTGRKGRTGTFPQKMHQMLSDLEKEEGGTEIACFLTHGRAFAIHKPKEFVKTIMPKYFRMSRFSSFQRQLNLYDFQRITEAPNKGAYFHELFVKGRPILSTQIKRNKIKGVTAGTTAARCGAMGSPGLQQLGLHPSLGALGLVGGLMLTTQQAASSASFLRSLGGGGGNGLYPPV
jgi:hypothetical protein